MKTTVIAGALSLLALGLAASPSFAEPGFDNTTQNVIPGPLENTPANPAAADSAAARVPTIENIAAEKTHKAEKKEAHKDVAPYTK